MGIWSSLFGKKPATEDEACQALEELERSAELDNPLQAMAMLSSLSQRYSSMIGPHGPLHGRSIACIEKIKSKVDDRVYGRVPISNDDMAEITCRMSRLG